MLILVTYDVETVTPEGRARLRKVAKTCVDYGQRVQNSVFECSLDSTQYAVLKHKLEGLIVKDKDSLRFYRIGKNWQGKVEHMGAKSSYDPEGILMV